jgi:hypothetical protein
MPPKMTGAPMFSQERVPLSLEACKNLLIHFSSYGNIYTNLKRIMGGESDGDEQFFDMEVAKSFVEGTWLDGISSQERVSLLISSLEELLIKGVTPNIGLLQILNTFKDSEVIEAGELLVRNHTADVETVEAFFRKVVPLHHGNPDIELTKGYLIKSVFDHQDTYTEIPREERERRQSEADLFVEVKE